MIKKFVLIRWSFAPNNWQKGIEIDISVDLAHLGTLTLETFNLDIHWLPNWEGASVIEPFTLRSTNFLNIGSNFEVLSRLNNDKIADLKDKKWAIFSRSAVIGRSEFGQFGFSETRKSALRSFVNLGTHRKFVIEGCFGGTVEIAQLPGLGEANIEVYLSDHKAPIQLAAVISGVLLLHRCL